ncbi:MAG: DUF1249 domain-containing protein [Pseudomonadales bacterium]|nr:DUF1249 domain-containing protein [Pseudomonadales bacterium]
MKQRKRRYVPDLVAEMAECDANYIRLLRLFPQMKKKDSLVFGVDSALHEKSFEPSAEGSLAALDTDYCGYDESMSVNGGAGNSAPDATPDAIVTIKVVERCRYTTMLAVKVVNEQDKPWVKWPGLEVRVYHDIKSAEVVSFERHRHLKFRYSTPNAEMYQPDEKSQINRFFGELLTFCYANGLSLDKLELGPNS